MHNGIMELGLIIMSHNCALVGLAEFIRVPQDGVRVVLRANVVQQWLQTAERTKTTSTGTICVTIDTLFRARK
jgi:hypothetical protein